MKTIVTTLLILCLVVLTLPAEGQILAPSTSLAVASIAGMSTPQNASGYILDAKARAAGRDWTDALAVTTRGLAAYPDNAGLLCVQGYAYRKLGEYKKAVEDVSRSILIDPEPVRFANRGYAYLAIRDYSAALADAKAGILMNASYPVNYGVEALALHGLGQTTGAISSIQTAIDLSPGNVHFWHVKGKLLADSGDCIGAAAAFRKSLKIDPDYDLPYPGFSGARDSLESLNTTCGPIFLALPSLPPNSFAEYLVAIVQ